jgi:TatD DNase family protein
LTPIATSPQPISPLIGTPWRRRRERPGVARIVIPAVDAASFAEVRDCCTSHVGCAPAYGIHPLYVHQADETDLDALRGWLQRAAAGPDPPVALGEIGLDFFVAEPDVARQERFFIEQLRIARDADLPVLLHVRRSVDQVLKYLRRIRVPGGIAHAFNGSRQQAEEFIRLGFRLGFGGALTYSGSTRIRQLAASLPLASIVLETDAPDMPPAWLAGGSQHTAGVAADQPGAGGVARHRRQ